MKKRLLTTLLCLSMAVAMVACGKNSSSDSKESTASGQTGTEEEFPDFSVGLTEGGLIEGIKASDYIEIAEYKGVEIKKDKINITDKDFDNYMNSEILKEYVEQKEITDRGIQDKDYVKMDYVGKVDGKEFEGGTAKDTTVVIGTTQFIDDFIEQLKGHKVGDKFDIEVTFPKEYPNAPELAGKDAVFSIEIKSIKEPIYPEVNDAFVEKNFKDYKNAEAFLKAMREEFEFNQKLNYAWGYVVENSKVISYPEEFLEKYIQLQIDYYKYMATANGSTFEMMLASQGMTEKTFTEYLSESAKLDVQSLLCVQAVCEAEGITSTVKDIQDTFGISDASYLEYFYGIYGKGYLNQAVLLQKAAGFVVEKSVLVD